jgi:hypothetical protein
VKTEALVQRGGREQAELAAEKLRDPLHAAKARGSLEASLQRSTPAESEPDKARVLETTRPLQATPAALEPRPAALELACKAGVALFEMHPVCKDTTYTHSADAHASLALRPRVGAL